MALVNVTSAIRARSPFVVMPMWIANPSASTGRSSSPVVVHPASTPWIVNTNLSKCVVRSSICSMTAANGSQACSPPSPSIGHGIPAKSPINAANPQSLSGTVSRSPSSVPFGSHTKPSPSVIWLAPQKATGRGVPSIDRSVLFSSAPSGPLDAHSSAALTRTVTTGSTPVNRSTSMEMLSKRSSIA